MRSHALSASLLLLTSTLAFGAEQRGEWTMSPGETADTVSFSVQYSHGPDHHNSSSSNWRKGSFTGIAFAGSSKHDVHFSIERDAGTIDCQGFLEGEEGAGLFTFHPHGEYVRQMAALGFDGMSDDKLFAATLQDVSLSFARSMRAENVEGLDANKLIAFRIFHITPERIAELRATGIALPDANKLIAFQIHGVSPSYVRTIRGLGFGQPEADKLIALRIHGVTSDYIQKLQAHGLQNLTLDQIIALRIQGIN